jgi:hypothetical protein
MRHTQRYDIELYEALTQTQTLDTEHTTYISNNLIKWKLLNLSTFHKYQCFVSAKTCPQSKFSVFGHIPDQREE